MSLKGDKLIMPFIFILSLTQNDAVGQLISHSVLTEVIREERKASFNLEEIKVRWKKAALENCTGVPCVTTIGPPPPPPITCGTTTISDIDNNSYATVLIGNQCWMRENLRVTKYNDGTIIPDETLSGWASSARGARTDYTGESNYISTYGYLYNWYAAKGIYTTGVIASADTLNICPIGWHLPNNVEWNILRNNLGGPSLAGDKLKSSSTTFWSTPNAGNNSSNFSARGAGGRDAAGSFYGSIKLFANFWSVDPLSNIHADSYSLIWNNGNFNTDTTDKISGRSIRCLKN